VTVTLEPQDLLLLYTDGIAEAMAPRRVAGPRDLFGMERLDNLLLRSLGQTAAECLARIRSEIAIFTQNGPLTDDRTLIAIRVTAP
jgi:serine phosphatase RsbU (regulator of sigma subunit)